jgi:hypothetical protein
LLATAVPHHVDHGCRRRHISSVFRCFRSCFQVFSSRCCVCCNGYICML